MHSVFGWIDAAPLSFPRSREVMRDDQLRRMDARLRGHDELGLAFGLRAAARARLLAPKVFVQRTEICFRPRAERPLRGRSSQARWKRLCDERARRSRSTERRMLGLRAAARARLLSPDILPYQVRGHHGSTLTLIACCFLSDAIAKADWIRSRPNRCVTRSPRA